MILRSVGWAGCLAAWLVVAPWGAAAHSSALPPLLETPKTAGWVVEFTDTIPTQLPAGLTLTALTPRIALANVDPRGTRPAPLWWHHTLSTIRRVEPNSRFFVTGSAQRAPAYAQRDLRSTQTTSWQHLVRAAPHLFVNAPTRPARVAIIDTGIDYTHPDLLGHVGAGVNFLAGERATAHTPRHTPAPHGHEADDTTEMDYNGHGTHVAGIIGARHNDFGIDGLAAHVELLGLKVFDADGNGYLSDILRAVHWATRHRVDILNMSFGTYEPSALLADALQAARQQGMVLVAAAGNDGFGSVTYPAALPSVLAVGALGPGGISRFSNTGAGVALYAPGDDIMSTTTCMRGPQVYTAMSGTSAAAAHVTGLLAHTMTSGRDAAAALAFVQERTLQLAAPSTSAAAVRGVQAGRVLADLAHVPLHHTHLTHLQVTALDHRSFTLAARVQNGGNVASGKDHLQVRLRHRDQTVVLPLEALPPLAPGAAVEFTQDVIIPQAWVTNAAISVAVQIDRDQGTLHGNAPVSVLLTPKPAAQVQVGAIWVTPLAAAAPRTMHVRLRNVGNAPSGDLHVQGFGMAATHEGIWSVPTVTLTDAMPVPTLAPHAVVELTLPWVASLPEGNEFTWMVQLTQQGAELERAIQSWRMLLNGQAQLYYNQRAHMGMVEAAVELLHMQGIVIQDIHNPMFPYRGSAETSRDWGSAISIGLSNWHWNWATDWPVYPESAKTLIDGASACDGIDVAFGDTGVSTWDTHFWIVGENDSSGLGDHSALHKINALMLGGWGSAIETGALQAYAQGDKARAWWLVGHAAHLLGDLSTGAHTINRNWHGVLGDPYHDWMGSHYQAWPASIAWLTGGTVDPYRSDLGSTPERLRFLAYTVARVGASFPWHQRRSWAPARGDRFGDGSRQLGGDSPHYDAYLKDFFSTYPDHPHSTRDLAMEEALTLWNECIATDSLGDMQFFADCWDGGDGHVDRNNVDYYDLDGDLSRIADHAYTYGVRAIAGLIMLFATETGQI